MDLIFYRKLTSLLGLHFCSTKLIVNVEDVSRTFFLLIFHVFKVQRKEIIGAVAASSTRDML
jgi:hypothetical protein